jgi:hypothetical protein
MKGPFAIPNKEREGMHPTVKAARIAGAFYLSLVVAAPLRLIYIPGSLFVAGNATATVANIAAGDGNGVFSGGAMSDGRA